MKTIKIFYTTISLVLLSILAIQVGCKKDDDNPETEETVIDIDGNVYNTIIYGDQVWFGENLKVTRYKNGDAIPNLTNGDDFFNSSEGAYCYYNNDPANGSTYGCLYNWYAASDVRNICPLGWRVPSDTDWETLITYFGGSDNAGGKLKEKGYDHWTEPNTGATNESGFTALAGGTRMNGGYFETPMNNSAWYWSTKGSNGYASSIGLYYNDAQARESNNDAGWGFSVRCIKE